MLKTQTATNRRIYFRDLFASPGNFLAFGFGVGLVPVAAGSFGSLLAVLIFFVFSEFNSWVYGGVLVATFVIGIWICERASLSLVDDKNSHDHVHNNSHKNNHDHPGIVWDEMVGLWIALAFLPVSWATVVLGFVFFRAFDILKPGAVGWADRRLSGGLGIMLDDVIAGVLANLCVRLLLPFLPL